MKIFSKYRKIAGFIVKLSHVERTRIESKIYVSTHLRASIIILT